MATMGEMQAPAAEPMLPPGHYYWDGTALRIIEAAPARREAPERSQMAAAIETLALCGSCSVLIALVTRGLELGPFGGLAHALALLPVLMIDPVYRRVTEGQIDVTRTARSAWNGVLRARDARRTQPWWLRAVFYIALFILCLELVGTLQRHLHVDSSTIEGTTIWLFWLSLLPTGVVVRLATQRHRLVTVLLLAAVTLPVLAIVDPVLAQMGGRVSIFGARVAGTTQAEDMVANVIVAMLIAPIAIPTALAGYGLCSLWLLVRRRRSGTGAGQALA